jgi:hypothetical protein
MLTLRAAANMLSAESDRSLKVEEAGNCAFESAQFYAVAVVLGSAAWG